MVTVIAYLGQEQLNPEIKPCNFMVLFPFWGVNIISPASTETMHRVEITSGKYSKFWPKYLLAMSTKLGS